MRIPRDRLQRELEALSSRRPRFFRVLVVLHDLLRRAYEDEITSAAAAMAFDLFLGLIPLVAFMGYVAGALGESGLALAFDTRLLDYAPGPAAALARDQYARLSHTSAAVAPLSIVGFVWISSGAFHVALVNTRRILGVADRSYLRTRAIAIGLTLGAFALTVLSSIAMLTISRLDDLPEFPVEKALVLKTLVSATSLAATLFGVAGLYRFAGGTAGHDRRIVPGAIVAMIGFAVVSFLFSTYVQYLARYAAFYGGLAAVAMMLFWLWLSSLSLLFGAEVNLIASPSARLSRLEHPHAHRE